MSLAIAIAIATLSAMFNTPASRYHYWYSWSKPNALIGVLAYFLIAGGGGGCLAWGASRLSGAVPDGPMVWRGIALGVTGALIFRADVSPKASDAVDGEDKSTGGAKSLLVLGANWVTTSVDYFTKQAISRFFRKLTKKGTAGNDERLVWYAEEVKAQIDVNPATPPATRDLLSLTVQPHLDTLNRGEGYKVEARAHLASFCTTYFSSGASAKPK